eukprot:NODE_741_length_4668_cov_0.416721.p1 type:complete len:597 gc:universal NODE_741_length_4668_cov_0.416721:1927-3717(+)
MSHFIYLLVSVVICSENQVDINVISDCTKVINLAKGLNVDSKQPQIFSKILTNCCSPGTFVVCDGSSGSVVEIKWQGFELDGPIIASELPKNLVNLYLGMDYDTKVKNYITGYIPDPLPESLVNFFVDENKLTGTIPAVLPEKLERLWLWNNMLTGTLPKIIPSRMISFYVDGNHLFGPVPKFPDSLRDLDLGYPDAPGVNKFTGTVEVNKPYWFHITSNHITNVVIKDPSALYDCDISYTPLKEHINEEQFRKCGKNGLFSINEIPPKTDCELVANLGYSLHLDTKRPDVMNAVNLDCCNGNTGVLCRDEKVVAINWTGLKLDGTISNELPKSLQYLHLGSGETTMNYITGTIPDPLPIGLIELFVEENKLTGNLPKLPSTLQRLWAWNNQLTGELPRELPSELIALYVDGNKMSGPVPLKFPASLAEMDLGYDGAPSKNRFTGTIELDSPVWFHINYNYITNVTIRNSKGLDDCDISYNPLKEHENDPAFKNCVKKGLYSVKDLPSTTGNSPVSTPTLEPLPGHQTQDAPDSQNNTPLLITNVLLTILICIFGAILLLLIVLSIRKHTLKTMFVENYEPIELEDQSLLESLVKK